MRASRPDGFLGLARRGVGRIAGTIGAGGGQSGRGGGGCQTRISSVERLRTALLGARAITYTKPGSPRFSMEAQMVDGLLKRPGFSEVHAMPALENPVWPFWRRVMPTWRCRWYRRSSLLEGIRLVGPLPSALSMHINVAASVFAHSGDHANASAFIAYITRPEAERVWASQGITRAKTDGRPACGRALSNCGKRRTGQAFCALCLLHFCV